MFARLFVRAEFESRAGTTCSATCFVTRRRLVIRSTKLGQTQNKLFLCTFRLLHHHHHHRYPLFTVISLLVEISQADSGPLSTNAVPRTTGKRRRGGAAAPTHAGPEGRRGRREVVSHFSSIMQRRQQQQQQRSSLRKPIERRRRPSDSAGAGFDRFTRETKMRRAHIACAHCSLVFNCSVRGSLHLTLAGLYRAHLSPCLLAAARRYHRAFARTHIPLMPPLPRLVPLLHSRARSSLSIFAPRQLIYSAPRLHLRRPAPALRVIRESPLKLALAPFSPRSGRSGTLLQKSADRETGMPGGGPRGGARGLTGSSPAAAGS